MKQTIREVLEDMASGQINLESKAARNNIATLISAALKAKGTYTKYAKSEIDEQKVRGTLQCSICGKSTYNVEYDYIGSGTNHLECELKADK
jgi:hypothetical protein